MDPCDSLLEQSWDLFGVEWIAVFAFFDETGTHDAAPNITVAGYLFSKDAAKSFGQKIRQNVEPLLPINKHGVRVYHSTKCIGGYDQFQGMPEPDREHIVDVISDALVETSSKPSLGVIATLPKTDYATAIAASPPMRELSGDLYSNCLIRCIENLVGWLNRKNIPGRVHYVFESGCNHQTEAEAILAGVASSSELKVRYRWHGRAFVDKGPDAPQLYSPDLLAWEWQRAYLNATQPQRGEWRMTLHKLFGAVPHIPELLNNTSVGIRGMVNMFYGVTGPLRQRENNDD